MILMPGDTVGSAHCVNITILDDDILEDNEAFSVTLSSTLSSDMYIQVFGITSANVTIHEDTLDCKSKSKLGIGLTMNSSYSTHMRTI